MWARLPWILLVAAACDPSGDDTSDDRTNVPARYNAVIDVDGVERDFIVYVPEAAAGDDAAPVVLMFHGSGQTAEEFLTDSGWKEKADAIGLIAVFPQGLVHCYFDDVDHDGVYGEAGERRFGTKWASGALGEADGLPLCSAEELATLPAAERAQADHPLADDIAFFDALVVRLGADFVIDPKRIYATGFSNGGQFVSRLSVERSEVIAAGASAGAAMDFDPSAAPRPMSFVWSVGEIDDRFTPLVGGPLPLNESLMTDYLLGHEMLGDYLTTLSLGEAYTFTTGTAGDVSFASFLFAQSTVGADNTLRVVAIEGLGHQYPNGTNSQVSAAEQLWAMFSTRSLDD